MYKFYAKNGYCITSSAIYPLSEKRWLTFIKNPDFKKWLMRIKLTCIFLMAFFLQISLASRGQQVSMMKKKASLTEIFKEIKKQTGYDFVYKYELLKKGKSIDIDVKNRPLKEVLNKCFEEQPFTYSIENKTVIIVPANKPVNVIVAPINIKGRVNSDSGQPLPGASIQVKGSSKATMTDVNGEFTLAGIEDNAILVVKYLGFISREIEVKGQTILSISLSENTQLLGGVTVVGYGTQKRSDISSSIGTFKPNENNTRPVLGPDEMMQGRIAGVVVTSSSGIPGGKNRVSIRGIGSLSASNEPLYVIDGIPVTPSDADLGNFGQSMNALSELNPNDIESIDVLKDAASASIYGSRATNGVVLITTKSGSKGKGQITVTGYTGIQEIARLHKLKMADPDLYVTVINEAVDNYNIQNGFAQGDGKYVNSISNPYPNRPATDWLDLITRTAHSSNLNLSISGGTEKSKYYISGGYTNQQGTFIDNNLKKYNAKVNISNEVNSWLDVGLNTNFSYSNNNRVPSGYNLGTNLIPRALEQRTFDVPYKPNGSYYVGGTNELLNHNPIQAIREEKVYLDNYRLLANAYANIKLSKDLSFKTSFGSDLIHTQDYVYYTNSHPYGAGVGKLYDDRKLQTNIILENTANYKRKFSDLNVDFLLGHSYQKVNNSLIGVEGIKFPSPSFDVNVVAAEFTEAMTNLYATSMQSFFGRANFSWKNRYLLNLSLRSDGSSRFAPENRYGYFPAASAGWTISNEPFWNNSKSDLKLRASYGSTGNIEGVNAFAYQALTGGGYNYNNQSGIAITSFGNRQLTWEKANQFNAGFDLGLFGGALNFTADYFIKNTNNLLYSKPTHGTTGFTSIISNIGSMRNNGFEAAISGNVDLGNVKWKSDFNISFIKNKLTALLDDEPLLIGRTHVLKVGEEVGSFYIYKQLGIFQSDSEVPKAQYDKGIRAGDVKYEDVNGDGKIDVSDRQILGSANPDFTGGFNNTFIYKNFDLSVFMTFSYGNEVYETWAGGYRLGNGLWPMLESEALKRWTGPNTSNTTPRAIWGNTVNSSSSYSTRFLHDGSYLRFRTVSLGYTLPDSFLKKIKVSKMRVYVQADNLFLVTKYPLLDPEVNISLSPTTMGEDFLMSPQPRTINFGVNLNF